MRIVASVGTYPKKYRYIVSFGIVLILVQHLTKRTQLIFEIKVVKTLYKMYYNIT